MEWPPDYQASGASGRGKTRGGNMSGHRIISADDHVQEPKDMWQQRVPAALRDRAPKVVKRRRRRCLDARGQVVMKMGMNVAAGKKFEEYKLEGETYQTIRAGSFDPHERLKDMDTDGVEAQVLFPNAFWAFMVEDSNSSSPACAPTTISWPSSARPIRAVYRYRPGPDRQRRGRSSRGPARSQTRHARAAGRDLSKVGTAQQRGL